LELDSCEEFKVNYDIYQRFLTIVNEPQNDYKKEFNSWLDYIFDTKNEYYLSTAKNFRKKWFLPIIRSLTYTTYYIRNHKKIKTCFNNGFIESMNNKLKLVKRNAYGYRYFQNFRKRILLHLGFHYDFIYKKEATI
ncbi:MAG: transposase, partial [Coprobacillus sp.]